jgi:class I fructose-bisphosphate aldolase
MGRIFNAESGRTLIIPADHGLVLGAIAGLENPRRLLESLEPLGVDATLLSPGLARRHADIFAHRAAPARVLTVDMPLLSTVPGESSEVRAYNMVASVQDALRLGVECVKALLVWGIEPSVERENIRLIANLARECEAQEMPLMVEPVLWGAAIAEDRRSDPALIAHACRITVELGADIVKAPYVADMQALGALVRNSPVPVVILGGPRIDDAHAVLRIAERARDAGVKGIVFGRNVFQRPNAASMIRALRAIMHELADADTAAALLDPAES